MHTDAGSNMPAAADCREHAVSVIVPVYNDPQGVYACLDALSRQCHPHSEVEVIVVDNRSDPPLRIDRTYPFRLRVLICDKPGSYAARNVGATAATGDILAFTDADCMPDEMWLRCGVEKLKHGGGDHVVGGDVVISCPEDRGAVGLYQWIAGFQQQQNIERSGFCATANLFCTRAQFNVVGKFDERLLSGGDRDWSWRAQSKGYRIVYAKDSVVRTPPRNSLSAAIRQARRVAAGRLHLRQNGLVPPRSSALSPHRGSLRAAAWILRHPALGIFERLRVLSVAVLIRTATSLEILRLKIGSEPERR